MEKIKELRERTGAGMVDCKKALDEAGNDIDKAVEILRKKGITKAAKRGDRETSEGVIQVATNSDNSEAYIVQVNSETDFVARNEQFQAFTKKILGIIEEKKPATLDELFAVQSENGTVKDEMDNLSGVIGEKIDIKRFEVLSGTLVAAYSHMGGKIGVLVVFDKQIDNELATDVAMHIAAINPRYVNPEDVNPEELEKEKEIYKEQLIKEGKPENIIEKIMDGKVGKYYEEICLVKQEFIKDDKKKVEEVLGDAKVQKFIRYSLT